MDLRQSNDFLISLLRSGKPFLISRLGQSQESTVPYRLAINQPINQRDIYVLHNNNGIYGTSIDHIKEFAKKYEECLEHSTALAEWGPKVFIYPCEQYFIQKYKLPCVRSRILEPFYCIEENITPWSHSLLGKKVLIINPFVDSMKAQLANGFQIYKDKRIFLDGQEFVFYKPFVNIGFNKSHNNWVETFEIMCNDISKLDFDVALLGCGGYGLPLCDYIKTTLGKSAIYVGGGLQLLFGVMGKRWETNEMWNRIIAENDTKFVKPSQAEQIPNQTNIEGGCYW